MDEARFTELVDRIVERRITEAVLRLEGAILRAIEQTAERASPTASLLREFRMKQGQPDTVPGAAESPLRRMQNAGVPERPTLRGVMTLETLALTRAAEQDGDEEELPHLPGMPHHASHEIHHHNPNLRRSIFDKRMTKYEDEDARGKALAAERASALEVAGNPRSWTSGVLLGEFKRPRLSAVMSAAQAVLASTKVEVGFFACIILSSLILGVQIELESLNSIPDDLGTFFFVVGAIFLAVFVFELLLRILANGNLLDFFLHCEGRALNIFDTVVVLLSILEITGTTNTASLRVLRVFRGLRAIRVLKILRYITPLRSMIQSIVGTIRSLVWAMLLLLLLIFVFSCIFTDATTSWKGGASWSSSTPTDPGFYFGSLRWSMFILFSAIAGGQSWLRIFEAVSKMGWGWAGLFCGFICFSLFAVMNVMTGMFCQAAVASAEKDKDLAVARISEHRESLVKDMKHVFEELNNEGRATAGLTLKMLQRALEVNVFKDFFTSLDMDVADAWTLLKLLDRDGDFTINLEEFVDGCLRLRGNAKAVDVASLQWEVKAQSKHLQELRHNLKELARALVDFNVVQRGKSSDTLSHGPLLA